MTTYTARMMDAESGSEGTYTFDAGADLLSKTPVKIVRVFMDHMDTNILTAEHVDYELNFAHKNAARGVVTAAGSLMRADGGPGLPFLLMIARNND